MVVEYVAATALGDLRAAAAPASTQAITLSRGIEDNASFASLAARQLLTAAERYELLVACELVAALRAVRIGRPELTEPQQRRSRPAPGCRRCSATGTSPRTSRRPSGCCRSWPAWWS